MKATFNTLLAGLAEPPCRKFPWMGLGFWLVTMACWMVTLPDTEVFLTIHSIVLFAILVIVPLASSNLSTLYNSQVLPEKLNFLPEHWTRYLPTVLLLLGSLSAIAFTLPRGLIAGSFQVPWTLFTSSVALLGCIYLLSIIRHKRLPRSANLCLVVAQLYLGVGGAWLLADRLGIPVLQFDQKIIVLTGMHFHFAGFLMTLNAACLGFLLRAQGQYHGITRMLFHGVTVGVTLATPLLAVGITASPELEIAGAALLSLGMLSFAYLLLGHVPKGLRGITEILPAIVGGCLVTSMVLAGCYAYSEFSQLHFITVDFMVFSHGLLNGFGVAFLSTLYFKRVFLTLNPHVRLNSACVEGREPYANP